MVAKVHRVPDRLKQTDMDSVLSPIELLRRYDDCRLAPETGLWELEEGLPRQCPFPIPMEFLAVTSVLGRIYVGSHNPESDLIRDSGVGDRLESCRSWSVPRSKSTEEVLRLQETFQTINSLIELLTIVSPVLAKVCIAQTSILCDLASSNGNVLPSCLEMERFLNLTDQRIGKNLRLKAEEYSAVMQSRFIYEVAKHHQRLTSI
jgi:hypothetical protein